MKITQNKHKKTIKGPYLLNEERGVQELKLHTK